MRGLLATILRQLERDGQRCGGPVVLAGFAVGFGLVTLSSSLGQASRFGLELLVPGETSTDGPRAGQSARHGPAVAALD